MILAQIETQEAVDPNRRDPGVLEHLQELLIGAETAYADNWRASEASETLLVVVEWKTRYVYTYIYILLHRY